MLSAAHRPDNSDPRMNEAIFRLSGKLSPISKGRYLLGLSGGADSTALMLMLLPEIRAKRILVEAVHVNHGLRGNESDGDEQFCKELCKKEGIPLHLYRAELAGRTDEAAAREARYGFFRKLYSETEADALILAHHADDQAETFLMRLLRGAGPEGLECMKADETVNGIRILRPMLSLRREEIRDALRADSAAWREDSSNDDTIYLRNRIRRELMPVLESISGTAAEKICRAAVLIGKDNDALNGEAERILNRDATDCRLNAETLKTAPSALRSRVLRMWWNANGPALEEHALSCEQTEALEGLLYTGKGKINLPGGMYAVRTGKYLFLQGNEDTPPEQVTVTGPETVFGTFLLKETPSEGNPGDGKRSQEVPENFTRGCVIRTRKPGDRIRPFGSTGSRKLQDYLTDRKIAEPYRDRIPLLCRGDEVLLVCGVGAGSIPRLDSKTPSVRLTWHGEMPWME